MWLNVLINFLIATLKPQSNKPSYSNTDEQRRFGRTEGVAGGHQQHQPTASCSSPAWSGQTPVLMYKQRQR